MRKSKKNNENTFTNFQQMKIEKNFHNFIRKKSKRNDGIEIRRRMLVYEKSIQKFRSNNFLRFYHHRVIFNSKIKKRIFDTSQVNS